MSEFKNGSYDLEKRDTIWRALHLSVFQCVLLELQKYISFRFCVFCDWSERMIFIYFSAKMVLNACFRFLNQSFTLHLHGNIWTVSVFRFKKRLLAKVKKKYQKPLSKSHSWSRPCWMFQTRHTSKFCSAKKMAESPKFVSVLLLKKRVLR